MVLLNVIRIEIQKDSGYDTHEKGTFKIIVNI